MKHSFFKRALEGNNAAWTFLVGTLIVIFGHILGQIPISVLLIYKMFNTSGGGIDSDMQDKMASLDFEYFGIDPNFGFFLLLLSFVLGVIALYIVMKSIHKRSFLSVITPNSKLDWGRLSFGFSLWLLLALLGEGINMYLDPENYVYTLEWSSFIPLVIICLLVLPWQTSFEELFMRGYLMQGIPLVPIRFAQGFLFITANIHIYYISVNQGYKSALIALLIYSFIATLLSLAIKNNSYNLFLKNLIKKPFIPWIITSVIFGLLHGMNPEIGEFGFWKMMVFYIGTGAFLGLITILDESLEIALGIHFANNLFGALFVSFDGSALQTPTMFRSLEMDMEFMLVGWFVVVLIFLGIAQMKYKWTNWGKIFQTIDYNNNGDENHIVGNNENILDEGL